MSGKTRKLTLSAILIALYTVLSLFSIDLRFIKISLSGLSSIIGGLVLGPECGLAIGGLGAFMEQLLKYGISATTIIWIIPPAVRGLMVGYYSMKKSFSLSIKEEGFITILSGIVLTVLNTVSMYLDSRIYGYYSFPTVFGMFFIRLLTGVITSFIYLLILPAVTRKLTKIIL